MQKNNKKIILLSIMIVFLTIFIRISLAPLIAGDEFINYYNTLKIFNGEKMWEEVNIITTPFIYLFGILFFKLFGTKFIVYRLCNLFINILFFTMLYMTFRNLSMGKRQSLIYSMLLEIPVISYVTLWGVTYNIVSIIFVLVGLNLNLKRKEIKLFNLWQGIIIFLIFFTKHNIGIYYSISQILIELIIEERWNKIKNLVKQFSIVILCLVSFFIVLFYNNLLESFIDMSLLGLNQFANNISINIITLFTAIGALIICTIFIYKKYYDIQNKDKIIILSITGIMILFMIYPIANDWHTILGSMVLYIETIYLLDFNKIRLDNNKILLGIDLYLVIFIFINLLFSFVNIRNQVIEFDFNKDSYFYLCGINNSKEIQKVEEFIKSKNGNVVIISPEAGIYNLDLNLGSHGFFDEPYNGNIGSDQLNKMIKKLNQYNSSYILIHTQKKYIQEIEDFRTYIKENYNKVCEVDDFSVYKK